MWLLLLRVVWDMRAAHIIVDDMGRTFSLLHHAPADIKLLLMQGIQRWQMKRIASHFPEHCEERLWPRAMRQAITCKAGIHGYQEAGALRCLWAGGSWPRQRKHSHGFALSPVCRACGVEDDTRSHRWCRCSTVT